MSGSYNVLIRFNQLYKAHTFKLLLLFFFLFLTWTYTTGQHDFYFITFQSCFFNRDKRILAYCDSPFFSIKRIKHLPDFLSSWRGEYIKHVAITDFKQLFFWFYSFNLLFSKHCTPVEVR